MKFSRLVTAILLSVPVFAFAESGTRECLDEAKLLKQLKHYDFYVNEDGNGKPAHPQFNPCDPSQLIYKVLKALIDLDDFPRLTPGEKAYDQNIIGPSATEFFRSRVRNIVFQAHDQGNCRASGVVAYVNWGGKETIFVCPHAGRFSEIMLMGVLLHEARHLEGFDHVKCKYGRNASYDMDACDPSYSYRGSYAVSTELFTRLWKTEALPLAIRQEARSYAIDAFINRFNVLPLGMKNGFLVQDFEGTISHVSLDGKLQSVIESGNENLIVTPISFISIVMFDPDAAAGLFYSFKSELEKVTGGIFEAAFYQGETVAEGRSLRDFSFFLEGDYHCFLFDSEIRCLNSNEKRSVELSHLKARHFVAYGNRFGFTTVDGEFFLLPKGFIQRAEKLKVQSLERVRNPHRFVSYVKVEPGQYIGLTVDGQVMRTNEKMTKAAVFAPLSSQRFKKAMGPFIWSKMLEDL